MHIEVLVVHDCPHQVAAEQLVHTALVDLDISATVITTVITDEAQASRRGFAGSPTILLNGIDPFATSRQPIGLACRIYSTADGPAGAPSLRDLRQALKRAAETERVSKA